jgi:hypothetical protein
MVRQIAKPPAPEEMIKVEQARLKAKLEYNDKTFQDYIANGFDPTVPGEEVDKQEREFLNEADPKNKFGIRRKVSRINRIKEVDLDSPKLERKEFLTWVEEWTAKNWKGQDVAPFREHWEGIWYRQLKKPITDEKEHIIIGYERTGQETMYDMPFNQTNVDKIIARSIGSDKESIIFYVESPGRAGHFTYKQFVSLSWEECMDMLMMPGGPEGAHMRELIKSQQQRPPPVKPITTTTTADRSLLSAEEAFRLAKSEVRKQEQINRTVVE